MSETRRFIIIRLLIKRLNPLTGHDTIVAPAIPVKSESHADTLPHVKQDVAYAIDKYRKEHVDFTTKNLIDGVVKDYFTTLKSNGIITEFDFQSELITISWKELYPQFWPRLLAKLAKFLSDNGQHVNLLDDKPRLYHHLFPYEAGIAVEGSDIPIKGAWFKKTSKHHKSHYERLEWKQVCEEFWNQNPPPADWIMAWIESNPPKARFVSKLLAPHSYLSIAIVFTAAQSGRKVDLNFTLGQNES